MLTSQFDYNLPPELISQKPIKPRDSARLLILDRKNKTITHRKFYNVVDFAERGDVIVLNNSKVIPARLLGQKETGGKIEIFLLNKISPKTWTALVKGKIKPGQKVNLPKNIEATVIISPPFQGGVRGGLPKISEKSANHPNPSPLTRPCLERRGGEQTTWLVKFNCTDQKLFSIGQTPLPPYIKKKSRPDDYQTIYAKTKGSVAAPTAGLHFTKNLLIKLKKKGIKIEYITLHVGLGTFAPVKTDKIEEHKIHSEFATLDKKTAERLNAAKKAGHKIIACGTTTVRTLEAFSSFPPPSHLVRLWRKGGGQEGVLSADEKWVNIFIYPGYKFKFVDQIITNFHLPKSTLLMLVSAFAGHDKIMKAYQEAINKKYKFYSFGDAMLIK